MTLPIEVVDEALTKLNAINQWGMFTSKQQWQDVIPGYRLKFWFDSKFNKRAELYSVIGGVYTKLFTYRDLE